MCPRDLDDIAVDAATPGYRSLQYVVPRIDILGCSASDNLIVDYFKYIPKELLP